MSSDVLVTTPAQRQTEPHAEAVSRNRRQQATFRKVLAAAMATLREKSYADLTVRLVAARAKVAPATAYTYFSSKNHLIAEVYLDLVRQVPCVTDVNVPMPIRVTSSLRHLALVDLGADPGTVFALEMAFFGALVQAGSGTFTYHEIADRLGYVVGLILAGANEPSTGGSE